MTQFFLLNSALFICVINTGTVLRTCAVQAIAQESFFTFTFKIGGRVHTLTVNMAVVNPHRALVKV